MALVINGIDKSASVPNVNKRAYRYTAFEKTMSFRIGAGAGAAEKTVDVKRELTAAWKFVTEQAGLAKCNNYFRTLRRGLTLKDLLAEGDIIVHCLEPKTGYSLDDVPDGNAAGRDIGINPVYLVGRKNELAAILIHELAHVGGATTNRDADDAIAAETALKSCGCEKYFRPGALGLKPAPSPRGGQSRYV